MDFQEVQNSIDIKENYIMCLDNRLLNVLLKDKSSNENIIWATDMYSWRGSGFYERDYITSHTITGRRGNVIKPRIEKSKKEQKDRIKKKGEVFTPSWICNEMASGFDIWFGRKNVFNTPDGVTWQKSEEKITFPEGKMWQDYVRLKVLEITCGEAPFLASRYDTVTGKWIDVNSRVGLLDRKLRVINENVSNQDDWVKYAFEAYQSTYGFEWQGDSLLIARENLLFTFIDYFVDKFGNFPKKEYLLSLANVIAWNIFQMDGMKCVVPYSCEPKIDGQLSFFDETLKVESCLGCELGDNSKHIGIYAKIKNWRTKTVVDFFSLLGGKKMKFDFIIGNPPYQEENENTRKPPIYHHFYNAAFELSPVVCFISPARFLFNAGQTPQEWNKKMLTDNHFKVVKYFTDSKNIFNSVDIKGGVAITLRNRNMNYGSIKVFTAYEQLNNIFQKVYTVENNNTIKNIISSQGLYKFADKLFKEHPEAAKASGDGTGAKIVSKIVEFLPAIFMQTPDSFPCVKLLAKIKSGRVIKYIHKEYLQPNNFIDTFNVSLPESNGTGAFDCFSSPVITEPGVGVTDTFISIGTFNTRNEAEHLLQYIKTKFTRALLGVKKVTQHNPKDTWQYVPLQDFTENSDIDWRQTVHEIDLQLYKKYNLSEEEIAFIESHVKEMN